MGGRAGRWRTVIEGFGNPVVDGADPGLVPDAPTVVAYGHYDVQSPGDPRSVDRARRSSRTVRDGWLYARGVSDDKGNFYALIRAALDLAAAGDCPSTCGCWPTARRRSAATR